MQNEVKDRPPENLARRNQEDDAAIAIERIHARRLGLIDDFERHVHEGRFREYIPILNYQKLVQDKKIEVRVAFGIGVVVGFLACGALLGSF
jgi:hypothetical protein